MSFGGIYRPFEYVRKSLGKKKIGNSMMAPIIVIGSNFKRKGSKKSFDIFFWFVKLALQGGKGNLNSGPELCVSTRILLVHALEIDKGKEFQHISLF